MGAAMRAYDWRSSHLGPVSSWPHSLRVAVRILLGSSYPIYIAWGPQYTQFYNDATVAYRNACLNAVAYLEKFGYSGAQAYLLLGAAPIEGRVSGVVDIPNACCSLYLPTAIFDFDIRPAASGPVRADRGSCAVSS